MIGKDTARSYRTLSALAALLIMLSGAGCGGQAVVSPGTAVSRPAPAVRPAQAKIARLRHSIQAGAFSRLENAVRLSRTLQQEGLEAYYFADDDGLFKVRFGDYARKETARGRADALVANGIIDVFYIVGPGQYAPAASRRYGDAQLRNRLVRTAHRYIGLPYRWGGDSPKEGFDCSGLTMTVYRVNGLNLPRNSRQQYRAGSPVAKSRLRPGDLVFFSTAGRGVSHVGIYTGNGRFIHAPKSGQKIRTEALSSRYFSARFVGARTYLR